MQRLPFVLLDGLFGRICEVLRVGDMNIDSMCASVAIIIFKRVVPN